MLKLLRLSFLPRSTDLGLLALRVGLGATMLYYHGWDKLSHFADKAGKFPGVFGLPSNISLGMAVFAEFFCALLVILGVFTRLAALNLVVTMGVAFFVVHKAALTGPGSGELAYVYLIGFLALVFAGAGRYSVDRS